MYDRDDFGGLPAGEGELHALSAGRAPRTPAAAISTGLADLDRILDGGLQRAALFVVLADTGLGKSSFVEQLALEAARDFRVAHYPLELRTAATVERLVAKLMHEDLNHVRYLMANEPAHRPLRMAIERLVNEHQLLLDAPEIGEEWSFNGLVRRARAARPDVLIIDDLQHLDGWSDGLPPPEGTRIPVHALTVRREVVRGLHALKAELNCCILIPHQAKSKVNGQREMRPQVWDAADTIQLPRSADVVLALHRPFRGDPARDSTFEIIARKNRFGPECVQHYFRVGKQLRFEEMTPDEEAALECCNAQPRRRRRS